MEKRAALELQRTCRDALGTCMLEFKRYAVMNRFMAEHKEAKLGKETRFKFMVCVGPPRMGKTQLCMSKYGSKDTFYCNCQNVEEPNLNAFNRQRFKAIVFDEGSPSMVANNKALFQAGIDGVNIMESRCQQFSRWKFLYGIPLFVCTNDWQLGKLPADRVEWLDENSCVLEIKEKCWV